MIQYHYIDGQTPIDEDEKRDIIPILITREDLDAFEQENILEAREWLMKKSTLSKINIFTEEFILSLHKRMFRHVWKWAGKFRKSNKNIGAEHYDVPVQLRQLLDDARYWLKNDTYNPTELAVIFHYRLVKIHLFPNGNGRHARLVADTIVAKYGAKPLTWGGNFDLTKPDDIRKRYIKALHKADEGDYQPLIKFATS